MAANEQGFAMLGDLKIVKPGTAADWKTNVQDKLQKFSDVCQARTEGDSEQMLKLTTSCHACTKPHVVRSFLSTDKNGRWVLLIFSNGVCQLLKHYFWPRSYFSPTGKNKSPLL